MLQKILRRTSAPPSRLAAGFGRGALLHVAAFLLLATGALADPPPDANPALTPWFESLRQPRTGISCCSIADCRVTDARTEGDHFQAMINGGWVDVPPDKVLQRTDNPLGRAIVCWRPRLGILCFVRPADT